MKMKLPPFPSINLERISLYLDLAIKVTTITLGLSSILYFFVLSPEADAKISAYATARVDAITKAGGKTDGLWLTSLMNSEASSRALESVSATLSKTIQQSQEPGTKDKLLTLQRNINNETSKIQSDQANLKEKLASNAKESQSMSARNGWLYLGIEMDGKIVIPERETRAVDEKADLLSIKTIRVLENTPLCDNLHSNVKRYDDTPSERHTGPVLLVKADTVLQLSGPVVTQSTIGSGQLAWAPVQVPASRLLETSAK